MSVVHWAKDLFAEDMLRKFGLSWDEQEIPIEKIDWEASARNGARLGVPILTEHVNSLSSAMLAGDKIPMLVLKSDGGKFVIFGGNHRGPAAREIGSKTIRAYVIKSNDELVDFALPAALNPPIRPQDREERLRLAVTCVSKGMEVGDAADKFSFPVALIQEEIRIDSCREELSRLHIPHEKLPKKTIHAISALKNPNVMAPFARVIIAAKLTSTEASAVSQEIRRERTESQQMSVVAMKEKEYGINANMPQPKERPRRPISTTVRVAISTLERLTANVRTLAQFGFTEKAEKAAVSERINKLCGRLKAICKRSTP
jgi:ParB-like chromosome segregation protein Spo0J